MKPGAPELYPPTLFVCTGFMSGRKGVETLVDELRLLSCSMIFEVLARLSEEPKTLADLSGACRLKPEYLATVISAAVSSGLIEQSSGTYQLTKKGARTAIYLLVINEWSDLPKSDYRAIMRSLNRTIEAGAPAA